MTARWPIGRGMLALVLIVSCGRRTLSKDAGGDGSDAAGLPSGSGGAGDPGPGSGGGPGGQSGISGPGVGGSLAGAGGFVGSGGAGGVGRGGAGGTFTAGRGGVGGSGGVSGAGGISGVSGAGGISGAGGTGGASGPGGRGGSGGAAGRGGAGGVAGADCSTCRTSILPIEGRDVVYSAARNQLYVSVEIDADAYPNTIVVVDPATGAIVSAIPVGSNPGLLALSDDGSTLWVVIDGAHAFRKVTMSATPPAVGPLIHFPKANQSTYFDAASMAVLAGAPLSVVTVLTDGSYTSEVRVFDDGVPRATGASVPLESSVTAGPPGIVFGDDRRAPTFYVFTASPSGITATTHNVLVNNAYNNLAYAGGRVFGGGGDAIDVANLAAPSRAGTLPYQGMVARRDAASVLMLTITNLALPAVPRADIRIYSSAQLSELGSASLPDSVGPNGAVYSRLTYAGGDAVAFLRRTISPPGTALVIAHNPAFGPPIGGTGGVGGGAGSGATGGGGGTGGAGRGGGGGAGGTGGAPDPCPGCSVTTFQAYGHNMVHDPIRNLIYVASDAFSPLHPSSIVTADLITASVASFVPVGNDPQPLALSDDGSALWVGLVGERRVRRMTPGRTPVSGPAYTLPMLLTTGDASVPMSIAVLPGAPSSIAVSVFGHSTDGYGGGHGVFILDDGQLRANYVQPPEVIVNYLANGPPGYLLGVGNDNSLAVLRLGTVGATLESHGGLLNAYDPPGFVYAAGAVYATTGQVVDLTNPDAPLPAGYFANIAPDCKPASRSATRLMMFCPSYNGGPNLHIFDATTFTRIGSATLPHAQPNDGSVKFVYLGGDAVALLGNNAPLQVVRAPLIGSQP